MKASNRQWRELLVDRTEPRLTEEIDKFENEIGLRRQGGIDERVFAETRLRRGVYGQRYDNGQRHDGVTSRTLSYPSGDLTKGPTTMWDAPGMQRIKVPFGGLNAAQLEVLAELAEEYSDGIAHVTTRQDIQLHFVHIDDTPALMRRLAAVGITTREACGNSVRNVTTCPLAGVCHDQAFDVTPYADACAQFLLGHPDVQDFGRKFKVAFSGCSEHPCGLVRMHDLGAIGKTRVVDGVEQRGFEVYVGGGLGSIPHQAKVFDEFLPEEELLPIAQAMARVFARLGEKRNRAQARIKFLVKKLGIDEFRRLVLEERSSLPDDPRWTAYIQKAHGFEEQPLRPPTSLNGAPAPDGFDRWLSSNVYWQRQEGYATVTVTLPLGDATATQLRALADISRTYVRETARTTVEQNVVLRWVSAEDLPAVYRALLACGLGEAGAGTIVDVTSCPGTDTCKLGIASSRGLAGELRTRLAEQALNLDASIAGLRIKISGCFNSCGQHHVADLGFYGVSRKRNGYTVPHFQVILGGQWSENAGSYGLAIGAIPSRVIPAVVDRITTRFVADRSGEESFQDWVARVGKAAVKQMLEDLTEVPDYEADKSYYSDWGDPREFTIGDMGIGECAGEVVTPVDFELAAVEREVFEAQLALDGGDPQKGAETAFGSMMRAARALISYRDPNVPESVDEVVATFEQDFITTELFFDPYAGAKFARYFTRAYAARADEHTVEAAHQLIEEAQLFIEASHACYTRMIEQKAQLEMAAASAGA